MLVELVEEAEVLVDEVLVDEEVSAAAAEGMTGSSVRVIANVNTSEISRREYNLRCCLLAFMMVSFLLI
jgi:hypothetical protein